MKKILYLYLLLISAPIFSMQPAKKNQIPMNNKKPFITTQEIGGMLLVSAPVIHTFLTPMYIVAPPLTAGMILLGAAKIGATAFGTAMIMDAQENKSRDK